MKVNRFIRSLRWSVIIFVSSGASLSMAVTWKKLSGSSSGSGGYTYFTSNSSWVAPAGVTKVFVTGIGGGGGGQGQSSDMNCRGEGGGGGQFVVRQLVSVTPGQSYTVTIGTGGVGGGGSCAYGGDGTSSAFGALVLPGGLGGKYPFSTGGVRSSSSASGGSGGGGFLGFATSWDIGMGLQGGSAGEPGLCGASSGVASTNYPHSSGGGGYGGDGGNAGSNWSGSNVSGGGGGGLWCPPAPMPYQVKGEDAPPTGGGGGIGWGAGGGACGYSNPACTKGGNGAQGVIVLEW